MESLWQIVTDSETFITVKHSIRVLIVIIILRYLASLSEAREGKTVVIFIPNFASDPTWWNGLLVFLKSVTALLDIVCWSAVYSSGSLHVQGVQPAVQNILMSGCPCRISKSSKWLTLKILQGKLIREFSISRKIFVSMKFDLNKKKKKV